MIDVTRGTNEPEPTAADEGCRNEPGPALGRCTPEPETPPTAANGRTNEPGGRSVRLRP